MTRSQLFTPCWITESKRLSLPSRSADYTDWFCCCKMLQVFYLSWLMCFLRVIVWLIQFSGRCAFPPRSRAASPKVWSLGVWDGLNRSGWSCPWTVMQAPATSHSVGPGRWHFWLGRSRWHNGAPWERRERGGCQKWVELVEDSWSILVYNGSKKPWQVSLVWHFQGLTCSVSPLLAQAAQAGLGGLPSPEACRSMPRNGILMYFDDVSLALQASAALQQEFQKQNVLFN